MWLMCEFSSSLYSMPMPMPSDICIIISHEDVLRNMGLTGRKFIDKHKDQVLEMKRTFLEYMKATRLESAERDVQADAELQHIRRTKLQMNHDGYPIIPKEVMERQISKVECQEIIREYMNRHYCKSLDL